jgi:hypothetical protein
MEGEVCGSQDVKGKNGWTVIVAENDVRLQAMDHVIER